jgi:hypothetical protein
MIDVENRKEALEYPMESLGEEVEEKWSRSEAKGEAAFDISGIVPLEGKEMLVIFGNGDHSEGVLNVPLNDYAAWASLCDLLVDIIDCHVFNGRPRVRYALVKALSRGPG